MKLLGTVVLLVCIGSLNAQTFDFEAGLEGWASSGSAFERQPVRAADIRTDRFARVTLGGDYWRDLPFPLGQHGDFLIITDPESTGTLVSPEISLSRAYFSFLVGGTKDIVQESVELQVRISAGSSVASQLNAWREQQASFLRVDSRIEDDYTSVVAATGDGSDQLRQVTVRLPEFLSGIPARVKITDASRDGYIAADDFRFSDMAPAPQSMPVWGYADYHTHPMSHMAFGALRGVHLLWGCPGNAAAEEYESNSALYSKDLPNCGRAHRGNPMAEVFINVAEKRARLGKLPHTLWEALTGRLMSHGRSGSPEFHDFPSFLSGAHEQIHITQIRRDYEGGLRLLVAIATNNRGAEYLSAKVEKGDINDPLGERPVVEAQIDGTIRLAELNRSWMQIAYSPEQARQIIRQNKLAIVLGIEIDQLGELLRKSIDPPEEVDYLWTRGIRAVIPLHASDNLLGGASIFQPLYNSLNDFLNRERYKVRPQDLGSVQEKFFEVREGCQTGIDDVGECVLFKLAPSQKRLAFGRPLGYRSIRIGRRLPYPAEVRVRRYRDALLGHMNETGLREYGHSYVRALMNHGMILDIAHMSERSVEGVLDEIQKAAIAKNPACADLFGPAPSPAECYEDAYPAIMSHAHARAQSFYDMKTKEVSFRPQEYEIGNRTIESVRRLGGVLGMFTSQDHVNAPRDQMNIPPFANDCSMSSKSFAYSIAYALQKMTDRSSGNRTGVGMATDFTFIPSVSPRFGKHACAGYKNAEDSNAELAGHPQFYNRHQERPLQYSDCPTKATGCRSPKSALVQYRMAQRAYDFNVDGLAHLGLVPDMLQDLKNLGLSSRDFESLFTSAEAYIRMWEKTMRASGCDINTRCSFQPHSVDATFDPVCP